MPRKDQPFVAGSIIKKLEDEGVGRPATYASIIDKIMTRNYVIEEQKKRTLSPTDTGVLVTDALDSVFGFMQIQFTRDLELNLDQIAVGSAQYLSTVANFYSGLQQQMPHLTIESSPRYVCAKCAEVGEPDVSLSRRRKRDTNQWFWVCKNGHFFDDQNKSPQAWEYSDTHPCLACGELKLVKRRGKSNHFWHCDGCSQTFPDQQGAPLPRPLSSAALSQYACPTCGEAGLNGPITGKYGPYFRCSSCKQCFKSHDGVPIAKATPQHARRVCRKCGKPMLKRSGGKGVFFGCSGYPKCKHTEEESSDS